VLAGQCRQRRLWMESNMMSSKTILAVTMRFSLASILALSVTTVLLAQADSTGMPRVENARVEQRGVGAPIAAEVKKVADQSAQPQWIGYAVPEVASDREVCCNNHGANWDHGSCAVCRLEDNNHGVNMTSRGDSSGANGSGLVQLEGSRNLVILLRTEAKRVMRIRVVSEDCTIDAGGLPLIWLTGVQPPDSVAMLTAYVRDGNLDDHGRDRDDKHVSDGALTAIALHANDSADRALESFVRPDQSESLRKHASFWLGESRGKAGFAVLQKMAKSDPSPDIRAHVTFALSVSREPGAQDEMIRMAREDESSHVRGQALFWLAQKAGKKAVGTITGAIENDPDTEVKKKAVFALSQLPKDEGVPKLIEVAQSNHNPAVRKQAMFWLGQSNDPRALAFFEEVLSQ
jgi:HEAT repeats